MINLHFNIRNPFRGGSDADTHDYVYFDRKLTENKCFELQISKFSRALDLFELRFGTDFSGEDHAGPELVIQVWRYYFCVKLYDHRHWDYDTNDWEVYPEEAADTTAEDNYVAARSAYNHYIDNHPTIHSNRFPSFSELSVEEQKKWIDGYRPTA